MKTFCRMEAVPGGMVWFMHLFQYIPVRGRPTRAIPHMSHIEAE